MPVRLATVADAPTIADFNIAMAQETEQLSLSPDVAAADVLALCAQPRYGFYLFAEIDGAVVVDTSRRLPTRLRWLVRFLKRQINRSHLRLAAKRLRLNAYV